MPSDSRAKRRKCGQGGSCWRVHSMARHGGDMTLAPVDSLQVSYVGRIVMKRRVASVFASLLCAGLLACLSSSAAQAEIKTQWVDYKEGDTALQGYLAYDDGISGKRPGI